MSVLFHDYYVYHYYFVEPIHNVLSYKMQNKVLCKFAVHLYVQYIIQYNKHITERSNDFLLQIYNYAVCCNIMSTARYN